MKFLCLMPTYGRRASMLANSIKCFQEQTHEEKALLIYDDLGTLNGCRLIPDVYIWSTEQRASSVGAKYNKLLEFAEGFDADAVCVWDDDDIYLPRHLELHAIALQSFAWSKPSQIISAYHRPPKIEDASGRFHGSIAALLSAVNEVPWIDTRRATFDQEYIAALSERFGPPGDPLRYGSIQYVYRWQTSGGGHCSGLMGYEDWYERYQPDSREPIAEIVPEMNPETAVLRAYYATRKKQ
jgi:glycosyltransferase involved in cell wall biosynthesis